MLLHETLFHLTFLWMVATVSWTQGREQWCTRKMLILSPLQLVCHYFASVLAKQIIFISIVLFIVTCLYISTIIIVWFLTNLLTASTKLCPMWLLQSPWQLKLNENYNGTHVIVFISLGTERWYHGITINRYRVGPYT